MKTNRRKEIAKNEPKHNASQNRVQGSSLLESLLSKIDLIAPSGKLKTSNPLKELDQNRHFSLAINHLLTILLKSGKITRVLGKKSISGIINDLDIKISNQISEIMHQVNFQKLESKWRGLQFLVNQITMGINISINVLNVSKEELYEDLEESSTFLHSAFFSHVNKDEYGNLGGEPYTAIFGDFYFNHSNTDIVLLRNLSIIAASCQAPFISSVSSEFFGLNQFTTFYKIKDLSSYFKKPEYIKWRALRNTEAACFLGLCCPRFLLRLPYTPEYLPMKDFDFYEKWTISSHGRLLWGNSALALASSMIKSFSRYGWCFKIYGSHPDVMMESLPLFQYEEEGRIKNRIPTEIMISDIVEMQLADLGFIPLAFNEISNHARFYSVHSVQRPHRFKKNNPGPTANTDHLSKLPYLLVIVRILHYIKLIQRDYPGMTSMETTQENLNNWLRSLTTDMIGAPRRLIAKRPFSEAKVVIEDLLESPDWYKIELSIRLHPRKKNDILSFVSFIRST